MVIGRRIGKRGGSNGTVIKVPDNLMPGSEGTSDCRQRLSNETERGPQGHAKVCFLGKKEKPETYDL